jgi:hypothetical protein
VRSVRGRITSAQEGRFMVASPDGRQRLMTLAPGAGIEAHDLPGLIRAGRPVTVHYTLAEGRHTGIAHRIEEG